MYVTGYDKHTFSWIIGADANAPWMRIMCGIGSVEVEHVWDPSIDHVKYYMNAMTAVHRNSGIYNKVRRC